MTIHERDQINAGRLTVPSREDQGEEDVEVELRGRKTCIRLAMQGKLARTETRLTALLTAYMNHLVFSLELLKAEKRPVTIMAMSARMSMTVVIKGRPESKAKSKSKRGVVKAKKAER